MTMTMAKRGGRKIWRRVEWYVHQFGSNAQSMNVTREPASSIWLMVKAVRRTDWALVERVLKTAPKPPYSATQLQAPRLVR
jgi:hypothetical protein